MEKRGRIYNRIFNQKEWEEVNEENKEIMEDFLLELKQRKRKESTIKQYRNDWRIILIFIKRALKNKSILKLNKKSFRRISLWLSEELSMSNARVNRILSAVRSLLDYCEDDDEDYEDYETNVAKKVKGLPKETVREIYFLTDEQVLKLKDKLVEMKDYQKATLLMMAYDSIGRRNELFQIQKHGLLETNKTNIVIGKRGKKFPLIFFGGTKKCLELYLKQRGEDDISDLWIVGKGESKRPCSYETLYDWFVYMSKLLSELEGKSIPFSPHSLRHTGIENFVNGTHYVCNELGKKFKIEEIKIHAHHENVATTDSYRKNDSEEMLAEMFNLNL